MREALSLMIGLSAVDTLLSAFTAFLVLSLMIASPGRHTGGTRSESLYVIRIEKTTQPEPGIGAKLLVDATQGSGAAPDPDAKVFGGIADVAAVHDDLSSWKTEAGTSTRIEWDDCAPTTAGKCTALLAARSPKGLWRIRFRIAGAQPADGHVPESVLLSIRIIARRGSGGCPDQTVTRDGQTVVTVDFSAQTIGCASR